MFETYRMLGAQREAELLAEAERLHRGRRLRRQDPPARSLLRRLAGLRFRRSRNAQLIGRPELLD
jgi:hypothetical protein